LKLSSVTIAQCKKLRNRTHVSTTEQRHFLTVDELGCYLRVSRSQAYKLVWHGQVPRIRIGGQWHIPRAELERQLTQQQDR
jgi:excisionase family DNA binding protein